MTHRFHPLSGRDFEFVAHRQNWGEDLWGFRSRPRVLTWALCGSFIFVDESAEDGLSLDSLLGEVGGTVIGPGRVE